MSTGWETEEGEERLLAAAASAFAFEGLEAANVDSIALQAHVSKSFIYSRFLGKSDLYGALRRRLDEAYYRSLLAIDFDGLPPQEAVVAYVSALYDHHRRYPVLTAMMRDQLLHGTEIFAPGDHVAGALARLRERISAVLERGRVDGSFGSAVNGDAFLFISVFLVIGALSDVELTGSLPGKRALSEEEEGTREKAVVALILRALRADIDAVPELMPPDARKVTAPLIAKKNRISRILVAAETCFGARGLDRTTFSEIGDVAGVSLQLIYYYFKGKQELFEAVIENIAVKTMSEISATDYDPMAPLEAIEGFLTQWWWIYVANPCFAFLAIDYSLHGRRMKHSPSVAAQCNSLVRRIDAVFESGHAAGTIDRSMDAATFFFLGLALIPPAVLVLTPSASETQRLYFPLDLNPRSIIAFIKGALSG
jgi:AcrR family transcriptional regulator